MTKHQKTKLLAMKKRIIDKVKRGEIEANKGAELLGLSRVGFWKLRRAYEHYGERALLGRKRGPKSYNRIHNRTPEHLERRVCKLANRYPYLGPKPLSWVLEQEQIELKPLTIYRILKRQHVRYAKHPPPTPVKPILYTKHYPGQEIQVDTAWPHDDSDPVVEFTAIDDYSRFASARLCRHASAANAVQFIHYLNRRLPFHIQTVRTDNGKEFGPAFTRACQKLGINHIHNPPYHPERNGKVERLHKTIKHECYWRFGLSGKPLPWQQFLVNQYLHYYNHRRKHQGLGMNEQTPHQKLTQHLKQYLFTPNVNLSVIQYTFCQNSALALQ